MRLSIRVAFVALCLALGVITAFSWPLDPVAQAQEESAAIWRDLVNETRLDEGLDPYAWSRLLVAAAQRHADDLAENGFADPDDVHQGSDGSDEQERIEEAGYAAWTREDNQMVVAENVWVGRGTPREALDALLEDQQDRDDLLSDTYREIGVGVATDVDGRDVYVLNFGARPNVLPVFINDGAATTENREIAIRLTNERVRPDGEGATFIGEAIEIRVSNEPSFEELDWQPWAPLVSWLLPDTSGEHTVYVQFRDAAGRTAASADDIVLDHGALLTPTASQIIPTPTPQPSEVAASPSPTSESGEGPGSPVPGTELTITTAPLSTPSPLSSPASPSGSTPLAGRATPFPTWTPLPSPEPTPTDPDDQDGATLSLPRMEEYGRPLVAVGILQGLVVILAIYWVIRRGRGV